MRIFVLPMAAAALAASASAQNVIPAKKVEVPVRYLGTYHMASDSWTGGQRVGTHVLYNCTSPGNYYSNVGNSFATNADHLWIDEGVLPDQNNELVTQVTGFDFAYCSTDLDPTGNGGSVLVAFYEDHGSCATGECATCTYVLSGLPLSTTGNTACWAVGVNLAGGFECSTDAFGLFHTQSNPSKLTPEFAWAFGANPGVSGRNNTGPILDRPCANPLSNCSLGGSLQGNQNFFAWEDPAGVWTGCYWFGGVPWASFSLRMYSGSTGSNSFAFGYEGNANLLAASDYLPGSSLTLTSTTSQGGAGVYLVASASQNNLSLAQGTLVAGLPFLVNPVPMPGGSATVTVPSGVPSVVYVQAAETSGPATPGALLALSNGLALAAPGGGATTTQGTRWCVVDRGTTTTRTATLIVNNPTAGRTVVVSNNNVPASSVNVNVNVTNAGGTTTTTAATSAPGATTEITLNMGDKLEVDLVPATGSAAGTWRNR